MQFSFLRILPMISTLFFIMTKDFDCLSFFILYLYNSFLFVCLFVFSTFVFWKYNCDLISIIIKAGMSYLTDTDLTRLHVWESYSVKIFHDSENKNANSMIFFFFFFVSSICKQMYASIGQENHNFIKLIYLHSRYFYGFTHFLYQYQCL